MIRPANGRVVHVVDSQTKTADGAKSRILTEYYWMCYSIPIMKLIKPNLIINPDIKEPVPPSGSSFDEKEFTDALAEEKGARPLVNPKHEMFVRAIFGGSTYVSAYKEAISATAKDSTAKTDARRLIKRPEIAIRLQHLQSSIEGMDMPVTRIEAVRACTEIMRNPDATPDNKLKAIDRLGKMFKWFDVPVIDPSTKKPDPAYLHEFIKRTQSNIDALN